MIHHIADWFRTACAVIRLASVLSLHRLDNFLMKRRGIQREKKLLNKVKKSNKPVRINE
jgi:hypothetical protein